MSNLKTKLHELIESTNDDVVLENIYQALRYQAELQQDILDALSQSQMNQVNESIAQYQSGNTKSHEEVLQLLRQWRKR